MLAPNRSSLLFLLPFIPLLLYLAKSHHADLQGLRVWPKPAQTEESAGHEVSEVIMHEDETEAPRIRQASMIFGSSESAVNERSLKTHYSHGRRWGYPTHVLRQDSVDGKQFGKLVFNKILFLQALAIREMIKPLQKRSEWIVWVDSDSILLNENIPWTAFLPPADGFQHIHLVAAKDWNGFNSGVFFLRVNAWTVQMLTDVLALPSLRQDVNLGYNTEQTAMVWVFNQAGRYEHILYQPRPWFNGYEEANDAPTVQDGDILIHFAGYGEAKPAAMGRWLDKLDSQEKHHLQVPFENTTYPGQIHEYWSRLRRAQEIFDRVEEHRVDQWANFPDATAIERVQLAETKLKKACWDQAFNDQVVQTCIEEVTMQLNAAQEEKFNEQNTNFKGDQHQQQEGEAESAGQIAEYEAATLEGSPEDKERS